MQELIIILGVPFLIILGWCICHFSPSQNFARLQHEMKIQEGILEISNDNYRLSLKVLEQAKEIKQLKENI